MLRTTLSLVLLVLFSFVLLTACAGGPLSTRERLTLGGGALGAATGALVGAASGGSAAVGAAIGGPVGLIGGFLIGDSVQGGSYSRQACPPGTSYQVQGYKRKAPLTKHSSAAAKPANSAAGGQVY